MMAPEVPYLIAGAVSVAGGYAKEHGWPRNGTKAVVATGVLVLVSSVTAGTGIEGFVTALGWLLVAAAVYGAVPALTAGKGKAKNG